MKKYIVRRRYEALKLANEIGNKAAAERLGISSIPCTRGSAKLKPEGWFCDNPEYAITDPNRLKQLEELREARRN